MEIHPPISEDQVERTRFYSYLFMELKHRKETLDLLMQAHDATEKRMHQRMDDMHKSVDELIHAYRTQDTRNKTLYSVAAVVWIILSGAIGWVWDRATGKVEQVLTHIAELDKRLGEEELAHRQAYGELQQLKSLKGQIQTLQDDVTNLQQGHRK